MPRTKVVHPTEKPASTPRGVEEVYNAGTAVSVRIA
jgi:hypothetical protein